ncbi:MAG: TRAP transporter substrate-binding protein DctP [Synergistaceae bacterium]|nr:TRAP transporter substrate-binding protein DctP [Synergistaceae bacterium]
MKKILIALVLISIFATSASAALNWRIVSHAMPGTIQHKIVEDFCETVKTISQGELIIEPFSAGVLFPVFESFDNIANGVVEMGSVYGAYWPGKHPGFLLTTRPGCPLSTFAEGAYLDEKLEPFFANIYKKFGIQHLGHLMVSPIYEQLMSVVPVNSIADLKGKKIRTSGIGALYYEALGATPVGLPAPEIYPALQTKNLDAAEWTFWDDNMRMNFHEVVNYVVDPAFQNGTCEYYPLVVNQDKWDSLSQHLKDVVIVARDRARYHSAMVYVTEMISREKWRALPNITIVRWSPEDEATARSVGQKLIKDECEKTEEGKWYLQVYRDTLWELGYKDEAKNLGYEEKK